MSQIVRLKNTTLLNNTPLGEFSHYTTLDLHTTRTVYVHSSGLSSQFTLFNFNMDTIICLGSVRATYTEIMFD